MSFFSTITTGTGVAVTVAVLVTLPANSTTGFVCILPVTSLTATLTGVGVLEFTLRFFELLPSFVSTISELSLLSLTPPTLSVDLTVSVAPLSATTVFSSSEFLALLTLLEFTLDLSVFLLLELWTVFCDDDDVDDEPDLELELAVFELEDDVLLFDDDDFRFADDDDVVDADDDDAGIAVDAFDAF